MRSYLYHQALCKYGEDVCGDNFKHTAGEDNAYFVLSDGLGSGIKANIFSNLTVEIILTMAAAEMPLEEIVRTVSKTLPLCKERNIAYSTFTLVKLASSGATDLVVYDNPDPILIKDGELFRPEYSTETLAGKRIRKASLSLRQGDSIFLVSDGVIYAGLGEQLNFGWGWENVAQFVVEAQRRHGSVERTVNELAEATNRLYGGRPGDDATVLGSEIREIRRAVVFTGPPMDPEEDETVVEEFLRASGTKIICGGTTANIVTRFTGQEGDVELDTARDDIPPMGSMPGIDLVTEGTLTMAKAIQLMKDAGLEERNLPQDRNGAVELARQLLSADHVKFIVGLKVNPLYQNPMLPLSISLRKYLVEEMAAQLRKVEKSVEISYH